MCLCTRRDRCVVPFTGLSFRSLIDTYKSTYAQRRQHTRDRLDKIGTGLEKVEEALRFVAEMNSELTEKEKVLDAETAKTDDALKLVS